MTNRRYHNDDERPQSCCSTLIWRCCDFIWGIACCFILLAIILGLVLFVAPEISGNGSTNGHNPFLPQDPPGKDEAVVWNTGNKNMLTLTLRNSLEERYYEAFDTYVQAWDSGSPDVLNLSSEQAEWDPFCEVVPNVMNVCSADFGRTDWRGINEILMSGNYIVSSVAKMNNFFLDKETNVYRMYTMCHEIGHGFGLPHTDVNYHNRDRGDCLDYTLFPRNNLDPGQYNFDLLNQIYAGGPPPVDTVKTSGTGNTTISGDTNDEEGGGSILDTINDIVITVVDNVSDKVSQLFGRHQNRRRLVRTRTLAEEDEEEGGIPADIRTQFEKVTSFLEQTSDPEEMVANGAEVLHSDKFSQSLQFNLGGGYAIRVSKLLVAPKE